MYQNMGDTTTNSFYPHQFHQPPFQNPNPNPIPNPVVDPYANPWPQSSASAPPLSSSYAPSSDYPNFPPPYAPPSADYGLYSAPTAPPSYPPNPNPQFPPSSNYPYDHNQSPNYTYDHNQAAPNSNLNPNSSFSGPQYSPPPSYDDSAVKFDRWGGFGGEQEQGGYSSQAYSDDGVYRYEGGKVEPYGARGTAGFSGSASLVMFDDYGRPINISNGNDSGNRNRSDQGAMKAAPKVVKASPKVDVEEDMKGGVQKFRVKVLAEGYGQNDLDVLCQVGLDGIRMLDPATGRTLRIYPFETVTRWEVLDSYIFAFWAKMPVDIEPKRIRIKSNSYTTNTILDTVTAASVQLKEIGERKDSSSSKASEQLAERKKAFDWMNLIKPANEEKDYWVPDEAVNKCTSCGTNFNAFIRKHHCRNCGEIFCDKCTQGRTPLTTDEQAPPVRVCDRCMAEVTQRVTNSRDSADRSGSLLSHEDLAKKLKEEMSRNSKSSAGLMTEGSQTRMRDVACPTCTVHLQVEVPASGSETIECSVCQHPFLVNAH